ncbi:ERC protein 2 isoform X21 [Columba livia]|uniref:ERC protein 2 isoform X21 n=1 Tax=Columba livia TaxID=8932 RepID=UPI0031BB5B5E
MYGSARTISNLEGSPSRSPRLPRSPRLGHRRTSSGGGTGKTLSMENIQSLNAAYATSGPMYLSDHEGVASTTFPKGTMTLGRATNRAVYGGRVTAMGSSPNIASAGLSHTDVLSYTDQHGGLTTSSHHHHHQVPSMLRQVRDSTMLDLQAQLKDLQRENDLLRKELDIKDSKLGSSMNSIKTFWSPELKKERVLRKEEAARMSVLKEQMRVSHEENQFLDARRTKHLQLTIQALQDELRTQRDLNHLLQQESGNRGAEHFTIELTEENFRRLQAEHDRQAKELFLLRKTLEEMELRIETQKQTLNARDESIKKLLEMLQSKGLPSKGMEDDNERTRRMAEAESQVNHLEVILDQKEKENMHLREELHRRTQLQPEPAKTKALQTVIEMKDTKIASLERNIRDLEDEIQMLKTNGVLNTEDREEEIKQIEVYKSHSKFMKNKIDQLKQELSKKESELLALQTKLETLSNQNSDCKQHIEVLKESLTAKEQRAAILQTEVDALRLRLEEKETFLNKKTKQLQDLTEEKGTLAGEIRDMKDMLEVKERKINVLQKKIENLQEQLRDKDKQLTNLKDRVKSLQTDSSNTDTALATLEEALSEKAHEAEEDARMNPEFADRMKQLDKEASYYREECGKAQAEVDRLLEILKEVENEKNDKDKKIAELESLTSRHMKDQNKKVANLKHNQQMEKKKNAQLLEEVRRREDNMTDNSQHLQVEELMNALEKTRQELDSTKARLASTQQSLAEKEAHLTNLRIERRKQLEEILEMKQEALLAAISEKDANIALLELSASKKKKTQEEVMALKREKDRLVHQLKQQVYKNRKQPLSMNLSSTRDVDFITDIPAKYLCSSHDARMSQTQNRMKLMADNYDDDHHHYHHHHHHHHHRSPGRPQHSNHRPSPDQMIQSLLEAHSHGKISCCTLITCPTFA